MDNTVDRLLEIRGTSLRGLARELGITHVSLRMWRERGVPADRVLAVERLSGGKITRYEMRPDVFGDAA